MRNTKIDRWTLGLAAVGLVTLSPALVAQTTNAVPQIIPLQTALSATTISGYVDTSAVWNPGTGNANPAPFAFNKGKQDGFNLDAMDVKIAKVEDESPWAAGYVLELSYGPDAQAIDGGAYPIRQGYVEMKMPIGNGLDWQLGRWDNLLGYESSDSYKNPNWTRSYAYTAEPTEHTGLLATYKFCDAFTLEAGVADTVTTTGFTVNDRVTTFGTTPIESKKGFVSLATLTAPDSFGAFKGSALYAGFDDGQGAATHNREEVYVGATINTPIKDLTFGVAWDGIFHNDVTSWFTGADTDEGYFQAIGGYVSYKLTEKLTINGRVEYADGPTLGAWANLANGEASFDNEVQGFGYLPSKLDKVFAITGTLQYDLWANVISRLEVRWDHAANGADAFGGTGTPGETESGFPTGEPTKKNDVMVAANVIYKF
jgi:Putative beta-barrel porin-2, OmpL-like. bbp2